MLDWIATLGKAKPLMISEYFSRGYIGKDKTIYQTSHNYLPATKLNFTLISNKNLKFQDIKYRKLQKR